MKTSKNGGHFGRHLGFLRYSKISKPLESAVTTFIAPQNVCLYTLIYMIMACQDTNFNKTRIKHGPLWTPSWILRYLKIFKPLESAFISFLVYQNICLDT